MGKGLTAQFNTSDIDRDLLKFQIGANKKIISVLSYVGEQFVNAARRSQTYRDITGNLRSSIGYTIVVNGIIKKNNLSGTSEGQSRARGISNELAVGTKGIVLIGFAGMEYSAAVESNGYDVITNSVKSASDLLNELKKGLGL
jgi:hypothetical protein